MSYEHLRFTREQVLPERHKKPFVPKPFTGNRQAHGARLKERLGAAVAGLSAEQLAGYDERRLLAVRLQSGATVPEFPIQGIELVAQMDKTVVLYFATTAAVSEFEARLATLARDGKATRDDLLFAIADFDRLTPQDRTGRALRVQGLAKEGPVVLDIELWPLERRDERDRMRRAFSEWLTGQEGAAKLDEVNQPSLVLIRVRCNLATADLLLRHRDVRLVDLPPAIGTAFEVKALTAANLPPVAAPPAGAPAICVLDAGITAGHPLLGPAVGDARGYVGPNLQPHDDPQIGHGTFVAGLALYGDLESAATARRFEPNKWLYSGRVFTDDGDEPTEFVENRLDRAVREFAGERNCRVFVVTFCDRNRIYDGRHVRGLAYTLDRLARELGVLFVVPTGNMEPHELPDDPLRAYPAYLEHADARLLDPAPAVNALTVGSIAVKDLTASAARFPDDLASLPIARPGEPSPFTRSGPGCHKSIKPDFVDVGGNWAMRRDGKQFDSVGLGVWSCHAGFAGGHLLREDFGTSCAAPKVANLAGEILVGLPTATANLLRALLGAHAEVPEPAITLLQARLGTHKATDALLAKVGYGRVQPDAIVRSADAVVTVFAEEAIGADRCQFFELPMPSDAVTDQRRLHVSVALAHMPEVRTTRMEYRATKLTFNLVQASGLDEVTFAFRKGKGTGEGLTELVRNRWISATQRSAGTLQVSRWLIDRKPPDGQKAFIVVTREDRPWSPDHIKSTAEPYALVAVMAEHGLAVGSLYNQVRQALELRQGVRVRV